MAKLRIGFVGVGGMGQMAHLSNYAVLNNECEVVALAEPRPILAEMVARRYGVPQVYANHMELIKNAKVDAIVAPQQYRTHFAIIPDILRAGIPVFTEKPLALTVKTGEELVKIAEENNVLHMVGYHKRSDPAMEWAKALVEEWKQTKEFGNLRYIRMTMPPGNWVGGADGPLNTDEPYPPIERESGPSFFTEDQTKQLDHFVNYYIHQVNAIRYFLGESYQLTFGDRSGVLLTGESESGVTVALEMEPFRTSREWHESILVCFQRGFIRVDLPAPLARQIAGTVTVLRDNGKSEPVYWQPVMPKMAAMRNQALNFIAAVQGIRPAPCNSKEAVEDLKLAENYVRYMEQYQ